MYTNREFDNDFFVVHGAAIEHNGKASIFSSLIYPKSIAWLYAAIATLAKICPNPTLESSFKGIGADG